MSAHGMADANSGSLEPAAAMDAFFTGSQAMEEHGDAETASRCFAQAYEELGGETARIGDVDAERGNTGPSPALVASTAANCNGGVYLDAGELPEARDWFLKALEVWPGNAMALLNIAHLEREYGSLTAAVESYTKVADMLSLLEVPEDEQAGNDDEKKDDDEKKAESDDEKKGDTKEADKEEDEEEEEEEEEAADWFEVWVVNSRASCVAQASYMLALVLHQQHQFEAAQPYLRRFGVRRAISPSVWRCVGKGAEAAASTSASAGESESASEIASEIASESAAAASMGVTMSANVLSPASLAALRTAFAPDSVFWEGTDYRSGAGYFSYWFDVAKTPGNLVDLVIKNELLPHVAAGMRAAGSEEQIVGAEWWVHSRASGRNLGHQLHFDTEEVTLAQARVIHPAVSSVCYLTGAGHGGPTVVFDQGVADLEDVDPAAEGADKAAVASPVDGALLTFPGRCLHGVLPGPPVEQTAGNAETAGNAGNAGNRGKSSKKRGRGDDGAAAAAPRADLLSRVERPHRLTLMVGFWTSDVQKLGKRRPLGPCAPFPRSTRATPWPSVLDQSVLSQALREATSATSAKSATSATTSAEAEQTQPRALPVRCVAKPWARLEATGKEGKERKEGDEEMVLEMPSELDQRFFVSCFDVLHPLAECEGDDDNFF